MTRVTSNTNLVLFTVAITVLFLIINFEAFAQIGRTVLFKNFPNHVIIRNSSGIPGKAEQLFGFVGNTRRAQNGLVVCMNGSKLASDGAVRPIPKIIHQLDLQDFKNSKLILSRLRHSHEKKLAEKYPNFRFILWNSSTIENLLRERYPWLRRAYHVIKVNIAVRIQIARYVILHAMGGVFLDIDSENFNQRLIEISNGLGEHQVLLSNAVHPFEVQDRVIMAGKGHAFIAHVLRGIPNVLIPGNSTSNADIDDFWTFLKERISTYHGKHSICFLPIGGQTQMLAASMNIQYNNGPSLVQILSLFLMIVLIVKFEKIVDRHVKADNMERTDRTGLDLL